MSELGVSFDLTTICMKTLVLGTGSNWLDMIEKVSIEALTHMNANLQISEDVVSLQSESCILHTNYIKILKQKFKTAMKLRLLCKTLSHVYHHKSRRMKKMITNSRTETGLWISNSRQRQHWRPSHCLTICNDLPITIRVTKRVLENQGSHWHFKCKSYSNRPKTNPSTKRQQIKQFWVLTFWFQRCNKYLWAFSSTDKAEIHNGSTCCGKN